MVIVLTSPAFRGYTIAPVSSDFTGAEARLEDDSITITVPEIVDLAAGQKLVAVWKLSVGAGKLQAGSNLGHCL